MQYFELLNQFQYSVFPDIFYNHPGTFMTAMTRNTFVYEVIKNNADACGVFFPYKASDFSMYMDMMMCTDPDIAQIVVVSVMYPEPTRAGLFSRQYCVMNPKNRVRRLYGVMSGMKPEEVDKKMILLGVPSDPDAKREMCADNLVVLGDDGDTEVIGPLKKGLTEQDLVKCIGSAYMGDVHDAYNV